MNWVWGNGRYLDVGVSPIKFPVAMKKEVVHFAGPLVNAIRVDGDAERIVDLKWAAVETE